MPLSQRSEAADQLGGAVQQMTRYFFDTEFYETESKVALISIGIVDEAGREFYAEDEDFFFQRTIDPKSWIAEHVLSQLTGPSMRLPQIADAIRKFVQVGAHWRETEFWAYYGAYDWYNVCKLFGGMLSLPPKWPWLFHDLRIFLDEQGFSNVTQPEDGAHHALKDAQWVRETFHKYRGGQAEALLEALYQLAQRKQK